MKRNTSNYFADKLLSIGALQINASNPFTWASGLRSPVYCDNRKILSYPEVRKFVKLELATLLLKNFNKVELIAGVATSGISFGVMIADLLDIPFVYVRSQKKDHGTGNLIEGDFTKGQRTVVIEDLVSTGKSSLNVVNTLRKSGVEVIGMCALFTYDFKEAKQSFKEHKVDFYSISNYISLLEVCEIKKIITSEEKELLTKWYINPSEWIKNLN